MRQDIEDLLRNRKSLRSVLDLSLTEIVTELNEARAIIEHAVSIINDASPDSLWLDRARAWMKGT